MIQVVLTFVDGPVEHREDLWRFDHFTARWLDADVQAELKKLRLEVRLS